jgi:hypothetical protein
MSPRFLRSNYGDLFGPSMLPVLEELFRSQLLQHPSRREQLFKIVSTDRDIWQASELHDMPLMQQLSEGEDYSFEAPPPGAHKTLVPVKYGLGFSISEEAVEDGKFSFAADAVAKLAKSAKESQEISAMSTFNNGFSTVTSIDGVSLFNTAHTLPSGATWRNKPSTDVDLSVTSLKQMLIDFQTQQVGDSGIIYNIQPKYLVVPQQLEFLAREIVGSSLLPDTAVNGSNGITNVNNMNSLQNSLQVVASPHLTDTDAWFVQAAPEDTGLRIIQRKPIETKAAGPDVGFKNDAMYYKCRYREVIGATQALGVFGTSGAT